MSDGLMKISDIEKGPDTKDRTNKLREKIKSKMDVAKFFTGFITLLIGFLLKDENPIQPVLFKIGIVSLITSLGFSVAALFTYDHLMWPKERFDLINKENRENKNQEVAYQQQLATEMVNLWKRLFIPAVGFFGFGFLFLLLQKLGLTTLCDNKNIFWMAALVIAFAAPIFFCFYAWPFKNRSNR